MTQTNNQRSPRSNVRYGSIPYPRNGTDRMPSQSGNMSAPPVSRQIQNGREPHSPSPSAAGGFDLLGNMGLDEEKILLLLLLVILRKNNANMPLLAALIYLLI